MKMQKYDSSKSRDRRSSSNTYTPIPPQSDVFEFHSSSSSLSRENTAVNKDMKSELNRTTSPIHQNSSIKKDMQRQSNSVYLTPPSSSSCSNKENYHLSTYSIIYKDSQGKKEVLSQQNAVFRSVTPSRKASVTSPTSVFDDMGFDEKTPDTTDPPSSKTCDRPGIPGNVQLVQRKKGGVNDKREKKEVFPLDLEKRLLCRWEETGVCPYGVRCQFAHGVRALRLVNRHPPRGAVKDLSRLLYEISPVVAVAKDDIVPSLVQCLISGPQDEQFTMAKHSDQLLCFPRMIALRLSDAILLFEDGWIGSKRRSPPQTKKFSDFLGIVGVGSEDYFEKICLTLDASISIGRQSLKVYAEIVKKYIMSSHTSRCDGPDLLLGGFDLVPHSRQPVYSFWLINAAGCTPITKSSYVVGCDVAEAIIGAEFNPSYTIDEAYRLGMKAMQNQRATCILLKKKELKPSSKQWTKRKT